MGWMDLNRMGIASIDLDKSSEKPTTKFEPAASGHDIGHPTVRVAKVTGRTGAKYCIECGAVFPKAEGEVFNICETCWESTFKGASPSGDEERAKARQLLAEAKYRGLLPSEYRRVLADAAQGGE